MSVRVQARWFLKLRVPGGAPFFARRAGYRKAEEPPAAGARCVRPSASTASGIRR